MPDAIEAAFDAAEFLLYELLWRQATVPPPSRHVARETGLPTAHDMYELRWHYANAANPGELYT